ncbi:MAG: HAD family hydrolase [bacterium]|nr:HAD family hydrolase [bacterium]
MIKAVIFDLDDTLVDTSTVSQRVIEDVYTKNIDMFGGKKIDDVCAIASEVFSNLINNTEIPSPSAAILVWFGIFNKLDKKPSIKDIVSLRKQMIDSFSRNVKAVFSVDKVFAYLRKNNIKIGVLTNGTFMEQAEKLIQTNLDIDIDYLVGTDMTVVEKPNAKAFNYILNLINANPQEVVMVGDSLESDIIGAMNVGMTGVLFRSGWRHYSEEEERKADFVISELSELIDLLARSFVRGGL